MNSYSLGEDRTLSISQEDITNLEVDAIVNAANKKMLGGGGVDGAIHRVAGRRLRAACEDIPETSPGVRCPTGEARITPGFELPAAKVIQTVGPVYLDAETSAPLLANAYRSSLELANSEGLSSIAFPAISCGAYAYPLNEAAALALETCRTHAGELREIRFALFGEASFETWLEATRSLGLEQNDESD
ncbi:MAG: macro domain-containing protein [Planctomycetota bacterium]